MMALPDGQTLGNWIEPKLRLVCAGGTMPAMLPMLLDGELVPDEVMQAANEEDRMHWKDRLVLGDW